MTFEEIINFRNEIEEALLGKIINGRIFNEEFYSGINNLSPKRRQKFAYGFSKSGDEFIPHLRTYTRRGEDVKLAEFIKDKYPTTKIIRMDSFYGDSLDKYDGEFEPLCSPKKKMHIGLSISHRDGEPGSIGGFVENQVTGNLAILSCDHVISNFANGNPGDKIHQPASKYDLPKDSNTIAVYKEGVHPVSNRDNIVDAAIAEFKNGIDCSGNVVPEGYGFPDEGKPIYFSRNGDELPKEKFPSDETEVYKIGPKTGYTTGRFYASLNRVGIVREEIDNDGKAFLKQYTFSNIFQIISGLDKPFALPGDSGSLVYYTRIIGSRRMKKFTALGIVIGGSRAKDPETNEQFHLTHVCSMGAILNTLDCEWINTEN